LDDSSRLALRFNGMTVAASELEFVPRECSAANQRSLHRTRERNMMMPV